MEYSLDIQRTLLKFNESVLPDDRINFIKNAIIYRRCAPG